MGVSRQGRLLELGYFCSPPTQFALMLLSQGQVSGLQLPQEHARTFLVLNLTGGYPASTLSPPATFYRHQSLAVSFITPSGGQCQPVSTLASVLRMKFLYCLFSKRQILKMAVSKHIHLTFYPSIEIHLSSLFHESGMVSPKPVCLLLDTTFVSIGSVVVIGLVAEEA